LDFASGKKPGFLGGTDGLIFWATVCKTVRPMLSDRCRPVCNVGVLLLNGWMDQDGTWHALHAGRPRPWPHCVRWGPSSPPPKGHSPPPQFSAHICWGQMAAWIKMPLGMEVDLDQGDFVLDGDPGPSPKRGQSPPPQFSAHFYCGQTAG